jgi:hypothetical protein
MAACRLPILPPRDLPAADYRRQARRLRARLAHRPAELYYSLRALADRSNHPARNNAPPPRNRAARFAIHVRQHLSGPILRYTQRTQLLHAARQHGIDPFEANLIIAAILHRCTSHDTASAPGPRPLLPAILTFLLIQSAILAGILFLASLLGA